MELKLCRLAAVALVLAGLSSVAGTPPSKPFEYFFAWNLPGDADGLRRAASLGVTDGTIRVENPEQIARTKACGIRPFSVILPLEPLWREFGDGGSAPLQKLSPEEEELWRKLHQSPQGRENRAAHEHHFGGEPPVDADGRFRPDVLDSPILCLNDPRTLAAMKKRIDRDAAIADLGGICFDYVGYQNYHDCRCALCMELYRDYLTRNRLDDTPENQDRFFRRQLIEFNLALDAYARKLRPDWKTAAHLYPVFMPDVLYGRALTFDFTGETAAWFFPWPEDKIRRYAAAIADTPHGVPFLAYYDNAKRPEFPHKSPGQLDRELAAIAQSGAKGLMMYDFADVLSDEKVCAVFAAYVRPRNIGKVQARGIPAAGIN